MRWKDFKFIVDKFLEDNQKDGDIVLGYMDVSFIYSDSIQSLKPSIDEFGELIIE